MDLKSHRLGQSHGGGLIECSVDKRHSIYNATTALLLRSTL